MQKHRKRRTTYLAGISALQAAEVNAAAPAANMVMTLFFTEVGVVGSCSCGLFPVPRALSEHQVADVLSEPQPRVRKLLSVLSRKFDFRLI